MLRQLTIIQRMRQYIIILNINLTPLEMDDPTMEISLQNNSQELNHLEPK